MDQVRTKPLPAGRSGLKRPGINGKFVKGWYYGQVGVSSGALVLR